VAVVQIATQLGVIVVLIHFGDHFEHDEAGRVVAASASGAIIGRTQGAGEAEVDGGADEPTEAAVDFALRGELNGMRGKLIVREPPAGYFGKRCGEDVAVVLIEKRVVLENSNSPFQQLSAQVFPLPLLSSPRERASPADCRWADSRVRVSAGVRSVPPSAGSGRGLHARAARYTPDSSRRARSDR